MAFEVPPLPYDYNALEPYIDTQTMQLHHDKHHVAYVTALNNAVQNTQFASMPVEDVLRQLNSVPANVQTVVRNNAGGHANHSMYWTIMKPNGGGTPQGEFAQAINDSFGSFDAFKSAFNDAGVKRFGSGWVWVTLGQDGKLQITSTGNQDSPWLEGVYPIMGNDVWEHAYYLKYQNRRPEYLNNWWNVVNWDEVEKRYQQAKSAK